MTRCPSCSEIAEWLPPHPADGPTRVSEWRGGFICCCGWSLEADPPPEPEYPLEPPSHDRPADPT